MINRFTSCLRICEPVTVRWLCFPISPGVPALSCSPPCSCVVAAGLSFVASAHAQKQEGGLLDRIDHPDRTLAYSPADKQFGTASAAGNRQATVHAFAFSHGATLRSGDGVFRTHGYGGKDEFRTQDYSTRVSPASSQGFSQTDKTFGTKSVEGKEDRAANKTLITGRGEDTDSGKPFLGHGKRQEYIDDLRRQKNLTIDQVREILNKNK